MFNSGRQQKPTVLPVFAPSPQTASRTTTSNHRKPPSPDKTLKELLAVGCVVALLIVGCVMMVHLHALDINSTPDNQHGHATAKRKGGIGRHQMAALDGVEGDVLLLPFQKRRGGEKDNTTHNSIDTSSKGVVVHKEADGDDLFNQLRNNNNNGKVLEDVAGGNINKVVSSGGGGTEKSTAAVKAVAKDIEPTAQHPQQPSSIPIPPTVGVTYVSRGNLRSSRVGVGIPSREVPPDVPPQIVFPNIYTYPLTLGDRWGKAGGNLAGMGASSSAEDETLLKLYQEYATTSSPHNTNTAVNDQFFTDMDSGKHSLNPIRIQPSDYVPHASDLQDILSSSGGGGDNAADGVRQKYSKGQNPSTAFWTSRRPALKELLLRYTAFHNSILSDPDKARKAHYVVVHPVGQLCNRLVAIVSGFVFALLTKRVMLVDDGGFYCSMNDLFDYPGFSWILGETHGNKVGGGATTAGMIAAQQAINGATGLSEYVIQNPEGGTWSEMEKLVCGDYDRVYSKTATGGKSSTVSFYVNQYVVPYYFRNPHYHSLLAGVLFAGGGNSGGEALDLFTPISTFLFRPITKLIKMRDKYIENNFYDIVGGGELRVPSFVVGLQVRSGGDFTDHFMSEGDWGLYRDCGYQTAPPDVQLPTDLLQQLHSKGGVLVKDIPSLSIGRDGLLISNSGTDKQTTLASVEADHGRANALLWRGKFTRRFKFFVATDTDKGRQAATVQLGKGGTKVLFGPTPFMLSNNPEGVQMALLDLLILATCDDRIATAWSSYGYFANGISGVNGNLVTNRAPLTDEGVEKMRGGASGNGVDRVPYWSGIPDQHLQLLHEKLYNKILPRNGEKVGGALDSNAIGGGVMVTGRGGSGGMDQRTSEQRYMGIMHKSDKRVQCVRLPTHQPCFHKFESWGASTAKCASWNITLQEEMVLGRYC